jgi:hypothetical protein
MVEMWTLRANLQGLILMFSAWGLFYLIDSNLPDVRTPSGGSVSKFVEIMTTVIPSIEKLAAASSIPAVTELFMSNVWVLVFATILVVVARVEVKGRVGNMGSHYLRNVLPRRQGGVRTLEKLSSAVAPPSQPKSVMR